MIGPQAYFFTSFLLLLVGIIVLIARKGLIAILIGIELILNAAALNFVTYAKLNNNVDGQVFALFVIVIAAAEAAIGLAIVIRFFQLKESIHIDDASELLN